jgi:dolichol-phosphate mannosyltransferase
MYNEAENIASFHESLIGVLDQIQHSFEIIYCDDGSIDDTQKAVKQLAVNNALIRYVKLSRNFGKEAALTAGIRYSKGDAIVLIDADGQHPVESLPEFIEKWQAGVKVVIGISNPYKRAGAIKRAGSKLFYWLFNRVSTSKLIPGTSDFRLIDRQVREAFLQMGESNRITRGLIDWVGFEREYVHYTTKPRLHGEAHYSTRKLFQLALNSFVSLSTAPLYLFGYIGLAITPLALLLGLTVFIEQLLLGDPLHWRFTGTAMLGILIIFLVGTLLMAQGMNALYISHIHAESKKRPLYIIDEESSLRLDS